MMGMAHRFRMMKNRIIIIYVVVKYQGVVISDIDQKKPNGTRKNLTIQLTPLTLQLTPTLDSSKSAFWEPEFGVRYNYLPPVSKTLSLSTLVLTRQGLRAGILGRRVQRGGHRV